MKFSRLPALDGLRGVLALVVLVGHVNLSYFGSGALFWPGRVAVLSFFFMSSLVLTRAWGRDTFPVFLVRRLVRLWPVYAVCVAAGAAVHGVRLQAGWLAFPFIVPVDLPAWSLAVEVWATFLMPAIVWAGRGPVLRTAAVALLWSVLTGFGSGAGFGLAFLLGARCARLPVRCAVLERRTCQWLGAISYSLYLSH